MAMDALFDALTDPTSSDHAFSKVSEVVKVGSRHITFGMAWTSSGRAFLAPHWQWEGLGTRKYLRFTSSLNITVVPYRTSSFKRRLLLASSFQSRHLPTHPPQFSSPLTRYNA